MAWQLKAFARAIILFIFPRYPFVNALTLLLLLAERAQREKIPPFGAKAIYGNVGLLFVCAVAMGFNHGRRVAAVVHAVQLLSLAVVIYVDNSLQYRQAVRLRMSLRMIGVAGFFLLFAFFISNKPRPRLLRRFGEIAVGIYLVLTTYSTLQVAEDREAFLKLVPGNQIALFVYATMFACIGLCYLPGLFVYDVTQVFVVVLTVITLAVDARMTYWTKRRGIDYWNQFRMVSDNLAILAGALMYLLCTRRKLPPGGNETQEDENLSNLSKTD